MGGLDTTGRSDMPAALGVIGVGAIAEAIVEARREAPVRNEEEESEGAYTYSSDRGAEPAGEDDKKRRRRPRRRRAKPEAIAARLKGPGEEGGPEGGPEGGAEGADAGEAAPEAE